MITASELYLARIQTTLGAGESDLTAADWIDCLPESKLDIVPTSDPMKTVSGRSSQDASVPGLINADIQLDFAIRSAGAAAPPSWANIAQAARLALTEEEVGSGTKYILKPSNGHKDVTVWKYGGAHGANKSQLKQAVNCVFDWKISQEVGKKAIISFQNGKGSLLSLPVSGTLPVIVKPELYTPALLAADTISIFGQQYKLIKYEISGNVPVEQYLDGTSFSGYGQSEAVDTEIKWSMTVYAESPTVVDPYTAWLNRTTGDINVVYGKTGEKISHNIGDAQIEDIKEGKQGNITSWDLTGISIDNNYTLTVNADLVDEE